MIMDKLWIISLILSTAHKTNGQSNVEVQLKTTNYVERGSSVTLVCLHNVDLDSLYKVAWMRSSEHKFFEYIHRRNPPFRNFSTPGADIDFLQSNASQVTLKNLDFDASAAYFCEVTIDNPIFTKASKEENIHVIVKQTGPPKIMFKKRLFVVGENLIANCTTTRAKPAPTITWLINGKKVDEAYTKILHPKEYSWGTKHNRSKSHPNNVHQHHSVPNNIRDFNDIRGKMYGTVTNTAQDSRDYESSLPNINETEYQYHPYARNGFSYPQQRPRHTHDRSSSYRLQQSYGNIITHSGIINGGIAGGVNSNFESDRNQPFEDESEDDREPNANFYDNKYFDNIKMHRNALNTFHKIRRHLNSDVRTSKGGSIKAVMNRPTFSSSQLSIEVSDLHADENGRLEISCISTIPAKISPQLDTFPDFKSYSVKIDVKTTEPSTTHSPSPTVAALSGSNAPKSFIIWIYALNLVICVITTQCLPFSIFKSTFLLM